jgi:hypothetical protein
MKRTSLATVGRVRHIRHSDPAVAWLAMTYNQDHA